MRQIATFLFLTIGFSQLHAGPFDQAPKAPAYDIEEEEPAQNTGTCSGGSCANAPSNTSTDCDCDCTAYRPFDATKPTRMTLPKSYSSRGCPCPCGPYSDLDQEWYEEDPSWPSRRERSWIDELAR